MSLSVADIPTPALLVDLPAMERNIRRMADYFAGGPCLLRPHFKAHKTPAIARRQLAAGSCAGITCATVAEAEVVVDEGVCDDVLIANQVLGPGKGQRVAALAARAGVTVAVDSLQGLEDLSRAATAAAVEVGVLVDVNVGLPRCGIEAGAPALALARRVAATPGVRLRGLMGYEGHVVGIADRQERTAKALAAMEPLIATRRLLLDAGLPCEIVSGGGTGTYDITGRVGGVTEIQAGSYALMDTAYAALDIPFEQASSVLGTVLSRPRPGLCVADCGHKACTFDHGSPGVKGVAGARVLFLSDEHATIAVPDDCDLQPGDRIELLPSHTDPTVNLHDAVYACDGERVLEVWPVAARGYREQRPEGRPERE